MDKKKYITLFGAILFFSFTLQSQNKIDSLRKMLQSKNIDRGKTLVRLSSEFLKVNVDSAIKYANQILLEGEQSKDQKMISLGYHVIGNVIYNQGKFKESLEMNLKAEKIRKEIHDSAGLAKSYNNLGMVWADLGDYEKSIEYYKKAKALKTMLKDTVGVASTALNLGLTYDHRGDYEEALACYYEALKMGEKMHEMDLTGKALNNIASIYNGQLKFDDALDYYKRSLEAKLKVGNKKDIGGAYGNIGSVYQEQGKNKEALEYFMKAEKFKKEVNDQKGLAVTYNNLGLVSRLSGDFKSSEKYYQLSLEIRKKTGEQNGVASTLAGLSELYLQMGNFSGAISYSQESVALSKKIGARPRLKDAYNALSHAYAAAGKFDKAYDAHLNYSEMRDSLMKEDNIKQSSELKAKYESEKQSKKIMELTQQRKEDKLKEEAENERSRQRILLLVAGIILILVTTVFLYLRNEGNKKANAQLSLAYNVIELKNKDITDSIRYAKRIQESILPERSLIEKNFSESFVLYKPKDIVSGDFYWFCQSKDVSIIAVADCTGHGVPGAFMSLIGTDHLNHIATDPAIDSPAKALSVLDKHIKTVLKQKGTQDESADGMDIALCSYHPDTMVLQYAGAYRNLLVIRKGVMKEYDAGKFSIGGHNTQEKIFTEHEIQLEKGDIFYLCTDGFADQFGGPSGKKYKTKPMKNLILSIAALSMKQQEQVLGDAIEKWRGNLEQVDDICIIGIKV